MNKYKQKEEFFETNANLFKVLSSPIRLKLINYISFCPRTVEECAHRFDQSIQNISLHLITLTKANILEVEQVKNFRYYSLSNSEVVHLVSKILASNDQTLLSNELIWQGNHDELVKQVKNKKVTLVDLRQIDESNYIPINGVLHFEDTLTKISSFLEPLPKKRPLLFFCKGRMCERLAEAVELAVESNFNVKGLPLSAFELTELGMKLES
ncbi:MAG: ArsR/SmtB family transcription factor [Bacteriovoracia bacterium]